MGHPSLLAARVAASPPAVTALAASLRGSIAACPCQPGTTECPALDQARFLDDMETASRAPDPPAVFRDVAFCCGASLAHQQRPITRSERPMNQIIARLWRLLRGAAQWRLLWLFHAKFMIGVTGIVRDPDGRVLLLRHRLWPEGRQWGLPTGYARAGETFPDTIVREVREETGLTVAVGDLARVRSGYRLRAEIAYEALHTGGELRLSSLEILEASWFAPGDLPPGVLDAHHDLITRPAPPAL